MRRKSAIALLLVMLAGVAQAQLDMRKGLKIGNNWALLSGDIVDEAKSCTALTGGIGLEFKVLGLLRMEFDILYSPRGVCSTADEDIQLTYISVPVVLKHRFLPLGLYPYLLAGIEFNYLLSAKQGGENIREDLFSQDLGAVFGAGVEFGLLGKGVYVEGRYSLGIDSIFRDADVTSRNRVAQVYCGFFF